MPRQQVVQFQILSWAQPSYFKKEGIFMRLILTLLLLVIFFPNTATALNFNCDLQLSVIPNTESSETKKLAFEFDFSKSPPLNTGKLTTDSCFGTFSEQFKSDYTRFTITTDGDVVNGTLNDADLIIGDFHYQLALQFTQFVKDPESKNQIDFKTSGNLVPLDNPIFLHQIANGECHLKRP